MASKDIINSVDVNNPSSTRRTADLLPTYHRTDKNTRFLASTLDQLVQQPDIERINGFVGSKLTPNYKPGVDQYIPASSKLKEAYQLEPSLVISDVSKHVRAALGYDDLVNELAFTGANVSNHDRLFRSNSYSYNPHIDWDKFVNFRQYYWMPTGPDPVTVSGQKKDTVSTYSVRDSADGYTLVFTPDGATTNPLLTLYRGMTYVFNVDSKFPFYIKTAYVKGISDLYANVTNNGTKKGQVIVTIDEFTPNHLFYYAEGNPAAIGQLAIKSLDAGTKLDVDSEIIGKKTYTSGNNVTFTNGMKVRFVGDITPEYYLDKEFIVEGVGSEITLVDFDSLQITGKETTDLNANFDAQPFDEYPFDDFRFVPLTPEYVTINRAALDKNPWSKYNRWVHENTLIETAKANGVPANLPADKRAQRPIVEFAAGLQLYNFGSIGKAVVDHIDTVTTDAFKKVEKSAGHYVDGILLDAGNRVIFNADKDPLVRGKIYEVKFVTINNESRINLEEVTDSEPLLNECVVVSKGNTNAGTSWWFNGSEWVFGQQKTTLNQAPLFEVYDENGNRFSDQTFYKSSFLGTKLFGYTVGTVYDSVLGFNLAYRNVANVGEYLFSNYFMTDTFTNFVNGSVELLNVSNGYLKINQKTGSEFKTVWEKTEDRQIPIIQYQVLAEDSSFVEINAVNQPGYVTDLTVELFVNDVKQHRNVDYTKVVDGSRAFIVSTSSFKSNDRVLIKLYTKQTPNENGYYEIPINLTNNPLNGPISEFSFTELSDHVRTMVDSNLDFSGVFPGVSNLRDIGDISSYGSRIVSHSNPMSFAHYFLGTNEHNLVTAIRRVSADYNQFKSNLLRHITDLKGTYSASQSLDLALISINSTKDSTSSYNYSDMLAYGKNNSTRMFTVNDPRTVRYSLTSIFDTTNLSERAVYVYLNGVQLIKDIDYTIGQYDPNIVITAKLSRGDVVTVVDYPSTAGSFIPPTPTKLGLYPKFKPSIYVDDTYVTPTKVIQGHDGSIMVAFNDYRDDIILEFEKRVYNNIKINYNPELFDIDSVMPGAFRTNEYSRQEVVDLLTPDFLRWAGYFGVDYIANNTFDELNSFTFNHTGTIDTLTKSPLNGYWRGIYEYYFDTDRPHTHPWEMLGFSEKPVWWEKVYGVAPYTSGNLVLWKDLEEGRVADPRGAYIKSQYVRPGLTKIIPVDEGGNLISPTDAGLSTTPIINPNDAKRIVMLRSEQIAAKWAVGDYAPAETAWRRSSWYPFAVQVMLALAKPASYSALMFDPSRMKKTIAGEWRYGNDEEFLSLSNVLIPLDVNSDGERILAAGYSVFVSEVNLRKNANCIAEMKQDFADAKYQLMAKLSGFVSKDKIQIGIDAIDPTSPYPGVLLPQEDYQIFFNKSSPIESIGISGLIIQKTGTGWSIRGYDRYNPYFTIFKPFTSNLDQVERVGGVSEKFVKWSQNTTYNVGQIVFYQDRYYRVITRHNSDVVFTSIYYQSLPSLPIVGGVGVLRRSNFDNTEVIVPYGVEYKNVQDVYDFIVGYGKWLESKGFVFDEYNQDLSQVLNWNFTAKEFLFWTTQNWAVNSVITLSPFANKIVFRSDKGIVDSIVNEFQEYSVISASGAPFPKTNFTIVRLDGEFVLSTTNTTDGIFFARINLVQKEHAIVMDNFTMFNDVVYDVETGYRQRRIKLKGFITKNWNGDFFSPGFVFDQANISEWEKYKDYSVGDVVRFSGKYYSAIKTISGTPSFDITQWALLTDKPEPTLIPNFDYKINQFEDFYSLDIDNFDIGQQAMAQHLVGYTPRPYLNYIIGDPIAQYKFYQGFIREKGTRGALSKLNKASLANYRSSIDFNEEWAFRIGAYGGFNTYSELETNIEVGSFVENPQVLQFVENVPADTNSTVYYKDFNSIIVKPANFDVNSVFNTTNVAEDVIKLPVAGYVRFDDVTATAYNKNSILDIANNRALKAGDTVWLGFREDGQWDVLRVTEIPTIITGVELTIPGTALTFSTYYAHQLQAGEVISVTGVGAGIDQCYIVQEIVSPNQFIVLTTLSALPALPDTIAGMIFAFKSSRLESFDRFAEVPFTDRWKAGEKVWVDGDSSTNRPWAVYEKTENYSSSVYGSEITKIFGQHYGSAIAANSNDPDQIVVVSGPEYYSTSTQYSGQVYVLYRNSYNEIQQLDSFSLLDSGGNSYYTISSNSTSTAYGRSLAYDWQTKMVVAGAPKTSKVRAVVTGTNKVDPNGVAGTVLNQGVVKLSLLNTVTNKMLTNKSVVITTPTASFGTNFGHSVALSTPYASTTTVKVSSTASISVGYAVTSSDSVLVGVPLVSNVGVNFIELNIPQSINTSTTLYFSNAVFGYTEVENTTTIKVLSTSSILVGSRLESPYLTDTTITVTGIGEGNVSVSTPQTINTSSLVTFVNLQTTGYTLGTKQQLFVGAPAEDATATGSVYVFDISATPGQTGTIQVSTSTTIAYSTSTNGELFGYSVTGNRAMTRVAVSAPGRNTGNTYGTVYVYDFVTGNSQLIEGNEADLGIVYKFADGNQFGDKVVMSQDGEYLVVASPRAFDPMIGRTSGVIDIFKWNNESIKFVHNQRISVPITAVTTSTAFGYDVSLSESNDVLVITSIGEAKAAKPSFDKYSERYSTSTVISLYGSNSSFFINDPSSSERSAKTTFDGDSTSFSSRVRNAGTAHVYNKLGADATKWAYAEPLVSSDVNDGSMFGTSAIALNNSVFVGAPAKLLTGSDGHNNGIGQIFVFDKVDRTKNSWKLLREEEPLVDITSIKRAVTIDSSSEQIQDYLDIIDPIKGKILGSVEEELRFITPYDPAVYSLGISGVNVDSNSNWLDEHVGDLWWDLSTVKYVWYEQGELDYRKNNWNNVFPGSSIDVYEWVRSEYLPAEWAQIADTAEGLTRGISGQPKFNDNSVISVKQVYNSVSNSFTNVYYYWVKNKVVAPASVRNRSKAAYEIARQIADPINAGTKFVAAISPTSIMLSNIKPAIVNDNINLNISFDTIEDSANRHTEWLLLQENDANSTPNWLLEKKLIDSLLGHDSLGNPVPDPLLPEKLKYGLEIRPRQSMFVNRREALRNVVEYVNSIAINERLTGQIDFTNLTKIEDLPDASTYDVIVEDIYNLELIPTKNLATAELAAVADTDGKISRVDVISTGFGYNTAPQISISDNGVGAVLQANINQFGQVAEVVVVNGGENYTADVTLTVRPYTALVKVDENSANKWALYQWNDVKKVWLKVRTQDYNTTVFWKYVDWKHPEYDPMRVLSSTVAEPYALEVLQTLSEGSYVKVKNGGDGRYLILRKTNGQGGSFEPDWDIVYSEKGTIQFLDSLWNPETGFFAWDQKIGFDQTQYDQNPDAEIAFILAAIKDDIFINERKIYWNQLWFKMVRYAMSEQRFLDWAFKTTFISVINNAGSLDQPSTYKLNNAQYYEDYLKEIKPYHTKIRKFTELYTSTEWTNTFNTDFDLPVYYNTSTANFNKVEFGNPMLLQYPWKAWYDNYTYQVETIDLYDGGDGYTQTPEVLIVPAPGDTGFGATAVAYISLGKVVRVIVTNPGQGYTSTPTVVFNGGGSSSLTPARAYAQLGNSPVRANTMRLRFDRVSAKREVGNQYVTETFTCTSDATTFDLAWAPLPNKDAIVVKRNGVLQLNDAYTVVYTKQNYVTQVSSAGNTVAEYSKLFATLKLLFNPSLGDVIEITYPKSLDLYNAASRIQDYYTPTSGMPGLGKKVLYSLVTETSLDNDVVTVSSTDSIEVGDVMTFAGQPEGVIYRVIELVSPYKFRVSVPLSIFADTQVQFTQYDLSQLMSGVEYSGLQVIGLPFNAAGGWDPQGIPWASTPWDNLGEEEGYTSYSTTATTTATFVIPKLIATGTSVNIYVKSASDTSISGERIDDPNFANYQGTWSSLVAYSTSSVVSYKGKYYQAQRNVSTSTVSPASSSSWINVSYNNHAVTRSLVGLGTGAVDKIDMIVTGSGYISAYTSLSISAPNTLGGRQAVGQIVINTGSTSIARIEITDPGSGYTEPPSVSILETINPNHTTSSVTIQAYARAVLRAEFVEAGTTVTSSVVTVPGQVFTDTSAIVVFRYATSDGTVTPTDNDSLDAVVDGGNLSMTTARGIDPSEIILDGGSTSTRHITGMNDDGFLNPINSYAPEECVPGQVRESLGISVFTQPYASSPIITNKNYWFNGSTSTFVMGVRPANTQSVILLYNDRKLAWGKYNIDFAANTVSLTNAVTGTGWLSVTSMQLGTLGLLDSFAVTTSSNKTVWTSTVGFDDVGSTYVTINGLVANTGTYTLSKYRGSARITVNSSGTIQAYLFSGTSTSFSQVFEKNYSAISNYYPLDPMPGTAGPFHSQAIVSVDGVRLKPPVTTYYEVANGQTVFDISKSVNYSAGYPDLSLLEVYVNGVRIQPSNIWDYDQANDNIFFVDGYLNDGDLVAIVVKLGHEYLIEDGQVKLTRVLPTTSIVTVVTFTNHDPDFIRSERFDSNSSGRYTMQRPVVDASYVWVTYNGQPLTLNVDYTVGNDNRTVSVRSGIYGNPAYQYAPTVTTYGITEVEIVEQLYASGYQTGDLLYFTGPDWIEPGIAKAVYTTSTGLIEIGEIVQPGRYTGEYGSVGVSPVIGPTEVIGHGAYSGPTDPRRNLAVKLKFYNNSVIPDDSVIITSFADTTPMTAYRMFYDMLGRTHFKRLSQTGSTVLAQNLFLEDTIIVVEDASSLTLPDPANNRPGVVLIDGERIEFFVIQHNVLRQLRRGTLGTSPRDIHYAGTLVVDQGSLQTIPYQDKVQKLTTASTTSTQYEYDLFNVANTSSRILFNTSTAFTDQVEVFYQGRPLLKPTTTENHGIVTYRHNSDVAYDSSSTLSTTSNVDIYVPHDFTINTLTGVLTLNSATVEVVPGGRLEVIKRYGATWYNSNDTLVNNTTPQAKFISESSAVLPRYLSSSTYIVKDITWYNENNEVITDENNRPLEGI